MTLTSASSEKAGADSRVRPDTPVVKAAAVFRKVRRSGAHSMGNIGAPVRCAWDGLRLEDGITGGANFWTGEGVCRYTSVRSGQEGACRYTSAGFGQAGASVATRA